MWWRNGAGWRHNDNEWARKEGVDMRGYEWGCEGEGGGHMPGYIEADNGLGVGLGVGEGYPLRELVICGSSTKSLYS